MQNERHDSQPLPPGIGIYTRPFGAHTAAQRRHSLAGVRQPPVRWRKNYYSFLFAAAASRPQQKGRKMVLMLLVHGLTPVAKLFRRYAAVD
jgi:hypothetical protein